MSKESGKPDAPLHFNWWTNLREFGLSSGRAKCTVQLMQNGQKIATLVSGVVVSSVDWQFFTRRLRTPKKQGRKNLTLGLLTAKASEYRLLFKSDDKLIKTYRLAVQNGMIKGLPMNDLNYEPHAWFISPRIIDASSGSGSGYKMLDAF